MQIYAMDRFTANTSQSPGLSELCSEDLPSSLSSSNNMDHDIPSQFHTALDDSSQFNGESVSQRGESPYQLPPYPDYSYWNNPESFARFSGYSTAHEVLKERAWWWRFVYRLRKDGTTAVYWCCSICVPRRSPLHLIFFNATTSRSIEKHLRKKHHRGKSGVSLLSLPQPPVRITDLLQLNNSNTYEQAFGNRVAQALDSRRIRLLLLDWLVVTNQPFSIVETPSFKRLIEYIRPATQLPSRRTLLRLLRAEYDRGVTAIKSLLQTARGMIHFTFDGWTSRRNTSFLGVTVYFIDRDWKQWCFLLGLPPLRGCHTGGALADEVYNILTYFGIEKQAFGYCTLDNAGNNDTAMAKLGELFHFDAEERRIRCAPHIINLVTKSIIYGSRSDDFSVLLEGLGDHITDNNELLDQALRRLPVEDSVDEDAADVDGAEAEDIDDMSDHTDTIISSAPGIITMESMDQYRRSGPGGKLHNIGVFLRRSSQLLVAFQEAQKEADPTKAPLAWIHNVGTQWESDHDMFQRALDLRLGIERFFYNIEASFTAERQSDPHAERPAILDQELSRHDWLVVGNLQKILHSFRASSRQLQGLGVALIGSSTSGGFDEYFPVIEDLLDVLETAVEGSVFLEDDLNPNGFRDYHIFAGLSLLLSASGYGTNLVTGLDRATVRD